MNSSKDTNTTAALLSRDGREKRGDGAAEKKVGRDPMATSTTHFCPLQILGKLS
jgi:hypothetical protein